MVENDHRFLRCAFYVDLRFREDSGKSGVSQPVQLGAGERPVLDLMLREDYAPEDGAALVSALLGALRAEGGETMKRHAVTALSELEVTSLEVMAALTAALTDRDELLTQVAKATLDSKSRDQLPHRPGRNV